MRSEPPRQGGPAGFLYALAAFSAWGIVAPVHFKLLAAVPPFEVLSQRIVWSCVFVLALIALTGRRRELTRALVPGRRLALLSLSAVLVGCNWLVYIWAVGAGHMVQCSLGYFINPLVNVALGILLLGERLRPFQILACILAAGGVIVLAISAGTVPWIALTLAFSFGFYGLVRKVVIIDPTIGFCVESLVLLPLALGYLLLLGLEGETSLAIADRSTNLLLVLTGLTTSAPLIWFAAAAQRLKLSTLGLMQYLAPTCLLAIGVLAYGEPFTHADAVAFGAIWLALAIYSADALGSTLRKQPARAES